MPLQIRPSVTNPTIADVYQLISEGKLVLRLETTANDVSFLGLPVFVWVLFEGEAPKSPILSAICGVAGRWKVGTITGCQNQPFGGA